MAHAQKKDFIFWRNGRARLNRWGHQFSRLLAAEVCASAVIVGSNAGYTMFRDSVKCTGYPLHLPVSPSLPLPCVTVCHHISTGVFLSALLDMLCIYISCPAAAPLPHCQRYVVKLVGTVPIICNKLLLTIQLSVYCQLNFLKWSVYRGADKS